MLIHQIFIENAKKYNNKIFFCDRTTSAKITYSKALIASLALSNKISEYGGDAIGIMLPTSIGCALAILGVLMAGKTPVMINFSTGATNNVEYAKKKCDLKIIITSKAFIEKIGCPLIEGMLFIEDTISSISLIEKIRAFVIAKLPVPLIKKKVHQGHKNDNLVILFTSGSEREPKTVQLTHRNILSNIESFSNMLNFSNKDSMLANLPFFHIFGLTGGLWTPLYHGMTIISYANPLDYKMICRIVSEEKPTVIMGTPAFLSGYLSKSQREDFNSVRIAMSGADKCSDLLRKGFLEKHNLTLFEGYGMTETSPVISVNTPKDNKPGSVGKVLPNVAVQIRNINNEMECGINEMGKIFVKGESVMKGYLQESNSPFSEDGWYDTGDIGYLDEERYLWHCGRLKRCAKIGGEMVSLSSVEDVMSKYLPEDVSICVLDVVDPSKGSRIIAAITKPIDERSLLKKMAKELPTIAMPKQFVVVDAIPKMGNGKVDFRRTKEIITDRLTMS